MTIIEILKGARDASRLERSEFGMIYPPQPRDNRVPYPTNENEVTPFIKDRVRLHHETWITAQINEVLNRLGA
jgi:hypothetical protein